MILTSDVEIWFSIGGNALLGLTNPISAYRKLADCNVPLDPLIPASESEALLGLQAVHHTATPQGPVKSGSLQVWSGDAGI